MRDERTEQEAQRQADAEAQRLAEAVDESEEALRRVDVRGAGQELERWQGAALGELDGALRGARSGAARRAALGALVEDAVAPDALERPRRQHVRPRQEAMPGHEHEPADEAPARPAPGGRRTGRAPPE